jgi:ATP-dependent Clp protease ATP-binding subunit ClpX
MNSAGSPLLSYKNYFEQHGISLSIDEDGVKAIAKLAVEKQLGARGLKTMLWQLLSDEMADVTDKRDIVINPEFITTKKY